MYFKTTNAANPVCAAVQMNTCAYEMYEFVLCYKKCLLRKALPDPIFKIFFHYKTFRIAEYRTRSTE